MTESARILLVEDDEAIAHGLALNLRLEGFESRVVTDGDSAIQAIEEFQPAMVLLDITLPGRNGLDVLGELREASDTADLPVIVVSARQNEVDKVTALKLGADDYVAKPFGVAELLARIEAVLRRTESRRQQSAAAVADEPEPTGETLTFGDVTIDTAALTVRKRGESIPLTKLQFELLRFLVTHPERVFHRDHLHSRVWGIQHSGTPRTVDNFVAQLRAKLEDDPSEPRHLVTVRGHGYRFVP